MFAMTRGDAIADFIILIGFFAVLAGLIVAANCVIQFELDQWRRRRAQRAELEQPPCAVYALEMWRRRRDHADHRPAA